MPEDEELNATTETGISFLIVPEDAPAEIVSTEPNPDAPRAVWNEMYMWRVHYTDGEIFPEVTEAGEDRGFALVDLARVAAVEIIPMFDHLKSALVKIDAASGMRPIFFRRRYIGLNYMDGTETNRATVTCLGWQKTLFVGGEERNSASYTFFFEDGSILITDDHNAI